MRKKSTLAKALIQTLVLMVILLPLYVGINPVRAEGPTGNIGLGYKQPNVYTSVGSAATKDSSLTVTYWGSDGGPAWDGDPVNTQVNWVYGALASSFVEIHGFAAPSSEGLTDFAITFLDVKVTYRAQAGNPTTGDQYRIILKTSTGDTVLQDWTNTKWDTAGNPLPSHRTFSNVQRPGGGTWDWTEIGLIKVQIESQKTGTGTATAKFYLYEAWLTAYATPYPRDKTISVQPSAVVGVHAGDSFYVDIYFVNFPDLWGYQIRLYYDNKVIQAYDAEYFNYGPFDMALPCEYGPNYVDIAYATYDGDETGWTMTGPVFRIFFTCIVEGWSSLSLTHAVLADVSATNITPPTSNILSGLFSTAVRHDVAVTDVMVGPINVAPGQNVDINATIVSLSTSAETFDASAFYDSNLIGAEMVTNLEAGGTATLRFTWDTMGVSLGFHQVKVNVTLVGDEDPSNDQMVWSAGGQVPEGVLVGRHDIAVTNVLRIYSNGTVAPPSTSLNVTRGETVYVNATVANVGDFAETFNVTGFWKWGYNIGNMTNVHLGPKTNVTLTFNWNTDVTIPPWSFGFDRYGHPLNSSSGPVEVAAEPVPYEKRWLSYPPPHEHNKYRAYDYTANNALSDGVVTVLRIVPRKLTVKVAGEFDYLRAEAVNIRLAALVRDSDTTEIVSSAVVNVTIYDAAGTLWISNPMQEKIAGSGIYEWSSTGTINQLKLSKGVYLVRVSASYKGGPTAIDILEFHIDPPAEQSNDLPYYIAFTAIATAATTALLLKRRQIIDRLHQPSGHI